MLRPGVPPGTMKILSWNYRGIGDPATVRELRDLLEISSPSILCLVGTQLQKARVEGLRSSLGFDFSFGVGSSGRSGGICIFWKNSLDVAIKNYSEYHVDVEVDSLLGVDARFTFVYGEAQVNERFKTWNMMRGIASSSSLPWATLGDFNEVLRADEHDGIGNRSQAQMDAFHDALDTCGLADIGYQGNP